jgi:hypothetical protein
MLVVPRLVCLSWRWMMLSGTPSRASSRACAWRSWCGANRRRNPARMAIRRNSLRTAAADQARPRVRPVDDAEQRPIGSSARAASHGRSCSQPLSSIPTSRRRPPFPRRTSSDPRRWSRWCSERERLLQPQAGAPEDDDHSAQPEAVMVIARVAHYRHDLVHGRWICRVACPCFLAIARRVAGHRHGRTAPPRGVQQHGHRTSSIGQQIADDGASEDVTLPLPPADVVSGFHALFRQFYADGERASFRVVSGVMMKHARAASDALAEERIEELKRWRRAAGRLRTRSIEPLSHERLIEQSLSHR